jgi:hypothetical protein
MFKGVVSLIEEGLGEAIDFEDDNDLDETEIESDNDELEYFEDEEF